MSIDYTLWPNSNGNLGEIKVQIPTNAEDWPEGDALVGNFVYHKGKLVSFVDTKALIANESKSTTFPYDYVNIQVDKSLEGVMTFNGGNAKYFTVNYAETSNSGDTIVLGTKYANCRTVEEVVTIDPDYITNDIVDGVWNQSLEKLEKEYPGESVVYGSGMFSNCSNLTTFTSDLRSLTAGNYMFYFCSNLTTFTSDLSSLTYGGSMFYGCSKLTAFTSDSSGSPVNLSSLTDGGSMFASCINLTTFTSDLSSLSYGGSMFSGCSKLTTFTSDLSSLAYGGSMFQNCFNLTTFTSDLSSLAYGSGMFSSCMSLTTFTNDLNSLAYGGSMFNYCSNLTTFTSDLSSLTDGTYMFQSCSNLTTFTSDLSSLIKGSDMFSRSKLTPQSVMYIVDSIKDIVAEKKLYQDGTAPYVTLADGKYSSTKGFMSDGNYVYTYNRPQPYTTTISASSVGNLTIGINVTNDSATIQQQLQAFAEEAARDNWADLKQDFVNKGWTVAWRYGGTGISITYDMRGDRAIPCPIYAQLEEVEDKDLAEYANEEGTKFYNINWGHDVTNYDDFQQFDSLEDAAAQMRLTKIGEVEIETV